MKQSNKHLSTDFIFVLLLGPTKVIYYELFTRSCDRVKNEIFLSLQLDVFEEDELWSRFIKFDYRLIQINLIQNPSKIAWNRQILLFAWLI
jgi:hypothetical protein